MGSDWKTAKLTEHYEIRSGLSKPAKDFGSGYPFLTFKDVFYNYFTPDTLGDLVESTQKDRIGCSVKRGDVFLTRTSETMNELGMSSVALKDYNNATFNGFCKRLRPKADSELVPEYVGYYLRSPVFRRAMTAFSTMSTRASLNNEMIGRLDISYPDKAEQWQIARVLKTFDEKITLNTQTNQTLEAMAQAIFKSWFVDFDPVKAKMNGEQPKGMDSETASLFPEKLVESELGLIPEGWSHKSIYDICNVIYGAPFKSKQFNTDALGVPLVRIRDLKNEAPGVYTEEVHPKGYLIQNGDIVVGMDGEFRAYMWGGENAWMNQRICSFQAKEPYANYMVKLFIEPSLRYFESTATATTVIHLGKKDIDTFTYLHPSEELLTKFSQVVDGFANKIVMNKLENISLSKLRDTLLPKLLSGEIELDALEVGNS
ncbi:restriction endonuclease subunit S [Vibrio alfacsensis]|uniref:restriction endonuclease subunit S n=1 Tax=Vibrio alfacsensis TaxID=1074311 RepID=UPI00406912AA